MEKKNMLEEKHLEEVILIGRTSDIVQTSNEANTGTVNIGDEPNKEILPKTKEQEANKATVNIEDEPNKETLTKAQAQEANTATVYIENEANKETSTDQFIEHQLRSSVNKVGKVKPKVIYPSNWSYPANLRESIREQIESKEAEEVWINIEEQVEPKVQVQENVDLLKTLSDSAKPSLNNLFRQVKMQLDGKLIAQSSSECIQPRKQGGAVSIIIGNKLCKEIPTKPKSKCICSICGTNTFKCAQNDCLPYVGNCHQQITKCLEEVFELADTTNNAPNTLETASLTASCSTNKLQTVELKHPLIRLTKPHVGTSLEDIAKQIRQETHSTLQRPILSRRVVHGFGSLLRGIFFKTGSLINENIPFILFFIFFGWFLYVIFGYLAKIPNLKYYQIGRQAK